MTPNEKAATFIGWEPHTGKTTLTRGIFHNASGVRVNCTCGERPFLAGSANMKCLADTEAPDMRKPENYMRALESVYHTLYDPADPRLSAFARDSLMSAIERMLEERNPQFVIEYLASLYDAEREAQS